jgi:uncharacterized protein (TIGR02453 family)
MNNILNFLEELAANNHKEWMDENRKRYNGVREEFIALVDALLLELKKYDPALSTITGKECIFRINRDVRFSKDKSPYKINMSAFISPEGKKTMGPGYYLHIQPGGSFLAGGIYMPPNDVLKKIRQEIDYNPEPFASFLADERVKQVYGSISGESLVRPPKGYSEDHPQIDLLKMKSFIVEHPLSDKEVLSSNFLSQIAESFLLMLPMHQYLRLAMDNE